MGYMGHYVSVIESLDQDGQDGIVFVGCHEVDDGVFDQLYREVIWPSFRPTELSDLSDMRRQYRAPLPGFHGMLALSGGEPVAGALGEFSAVSGVGLLAYLAVREDWRGRGLGSGLLIEALSKWRALWRPVVMLAEIEDPRFHRASGAYGDPMARMRMYERLGARMLPLPYVQPSLRPGLPRVHGMLLISLEADRDGVPGSALIEFLDEYVRECEGVEALSDPVYRGLRDRVAGWPDVVPLWPFSRMAEIPGGGVG